MIQDIGRRLVRNLLLALAISGCMPAGAGDPNRLATIDAISLAVRSTATADALSGGESQAAARTAEAQAAANIESIQADQTSQAPPPAGNLAQTQTALPIQSQLPFYGVETNEGRLGWVHPPVTLEVSGYQQYAYSNQFLETTAADFVITADITWNTQYGSSGCGFVLRSDGKENAWNQYLVIATRAASGHIIFATMADGQVVNGRDLYAYAKDRSFRWENDTTNRLTVVGRGVLFSIYTNGVKIGEVDPTGPLPNPQVPDPPQKPDSLDEGILEKFEQEQKQFEAVQGEILGNYAARRAAAETANKRFDHGFIAMTVLSESGRSQCQFNNAWLWLLNGT